MGNKNIKKKVMDEQIKRAAEVIRESDFTIAFTGAGISVESGVPPFRGSENSVWSKYDPECLEINYFYSHPKESWGAIKEIFYNFMFKTEIHPNMAHKVLARMEEQGMLHSVITQNIDFLHQEVGSRRVYEFHGTAGRVVCTNERCSCVLQPQEVELDELPPRCPECGALLKPDFIFFGEGIPAEAYNNSFNDARKAKVVIVVGTTGEVMPAGMIPIEAKRNGAIIIEVNPTKSAFTERYTDIYIQSKAGDAFGKLAQELGIVI